MKPPATIKVGRTREGYCLRIEGQGTLRESPAVREFAGRVFRDEASTLVVDLSACDYLDSTFLGCLAQIHKARLGEGMEGRFHLAAPRPVARRLLAPNHLESLFTIVEDGPEVVGEEMAIPLVDLGASELGWHIMECHQRLAEIEGPNRAAFDEVARRLARELADDMVKPAN